MLHAQARRRAKPTPIVPTVGIASVYLNIMASTHTGLEGSSVEAYFVMGKPKENGWRSQAGKNHSKFLNDMAQELNKHWSKMCKVLVDAVWADVMTWGERDNVVYWKTKGKIDDDLQ